jgi:hypothetical protein
VLYLHIYKEGFFWCAYEQSAWHFVLRQGAFKVTKKNMRKTQVCYIGFHQTIDAYFVHFKLANRYWLKQSIIK